jgi:hypothetical protein
VIDWIDAKKESPEYNVRVLLYTAFEYCCVGELRVGHGEMGDYWRTQVYCHSWDFITHWAHINAPESEGENE